MARWVQVYHTENRTVDILLNCAGIARAAYFEGMPLEIMERQMRVNCFGTVNMCRACLPLMKEHGGYVVNVAASAGIMNGRSLAAYGASKAAVIGFSQALRQEMKPHRISVSVFCPHNTKTPLHEKLELAPRPGLRSLSRRMKPLAPDEAADALLRGMLTGRFLILTNNWRAIYYLSRLSPRLTEWLQERLAGRGLAPSEEALAASDRRRERRVDADSQVVYRREGSVSEEMARLANISRNGMFIRTRHPLEAGLYVNANLFGDRFGQFMNVEGRVLRSDDDGMAVEITHTDQEIADLFELLGDSL